MTSLRQPPSILSLFVALVMIGVVCPPTHAIAQESGLGGMVKRRKADVTKIESQDRALMGLVGVLVPLATGIGLGVASEAAATATGSDALGVTGVFLFFGATVVSGPSAVYLVGQGLGYNGSYGQTLGRGSLMGLGGATTGLIVGGGLMALLQANKTCPEPDERGYCHMGEVFELMIAGGFGAGVGHLWATTRGAIRGYGKSLDSTTSEAALSFNVAPTALPTGEGRLVPGMFVSGVF